MPSRPTYDPTLIAGAVAAVAGGESVRLVAKRLNVPKSTVQHWTTARGAEVQKQITRHPATAEELERLVFEAVVATLNSITARALATGDPAWIKGQTADALAALDNAQWHSIAAVIRSFRPADAAANAAYGDDGDAGGRALPGANGGIAPARNGAVDPTG